MSRRSFPDTPDGRYFVANGRLWRRCDPRLTEPARQAAVRDLRAARRAVRDAADDSARRRARAAVQAAKEALGERGPPWWDDGTPDYTGRAPRNTPYAEWWAGLQADP